MLAILTLDFGKFKGHLACGDIDFHNIAHLVAKKCRRKRRGDADFPLFKVGLALGHDGIFLHQCVLGIANGDDGEQEHLGGVYLAFVEQTGIGHEFLKFGDACLEVALSLLGGIILGIFGEVAFVASLSDGRRGSRTLDGDELMQFVLQFLEAFFTLVFDFCHIDGFYSGV